VASSLPNASLSAPRASAPPAPSFAAQPAAPAPSGASTWKLGTMSLAAPAGRSFDQGLIGDFNGDGNPEAVAWTLSPTPDRSRGELWLFPSGAEPRPVFALPPFMPASEGCRLVTSLGATGPHTVTLDTAAGCPSPLAPRTPVRSITVLAPTSARPVLVGLRAAQPAPGEVLEVGVDSTDQDTDGRDDVRITIRVGVGSKTAAAAIGYLDRAAGPSPDPREPGASLASLAQKAVSLAKQKKNAAAASELAMNARRLVATLCAESGGPRIWDADGAPLPCGSLDAFYEKLGVAEVGAALTRGDLLGALGVLARDGWYGRRMSDEGRAALERAIQAGARDTAVTTVITPNAVPVPRGPNPRYSPLGFESPADSLLVVTQSGMVRVAPDGSKEEPVEARAWPLEVTLGSGARWTGYQQTCDRSEVELVFSGAESSRVAAPELLSARPGGCKGSVPPMFPGPIPLGTRGSELEAVVAGVHVGPSGTPPVPGSARSADGRFLVVPSPLGVLVLGHDRPELWLSPRIAAPSALTDCVISATGSAVACTLSGRVVVLKK
jgi:hypothetical protein